MLLMGVVAVLCAVIGVVSTVALYQFQLDQRDDQLMATVDRLFHGPPAGVPPKSTPPEFSRNQTTGALNARIVDGKVYGRVRGLETDEDLTASASHELAEVPADRRPHTVALPGLGDYRVVRVPDRGTGQGSQTDEATGQATGDTIIGLPLGELNETRRQFIGLEVAVGLGGVLLAASVGALMIQFTLRPLNRVAATARRVAELPLARGEVSLADRVSPSDADPRTEVGQVGAAVNRMLGHVGDALAARQASETRLRQFIADASHELRTPLAAIRGYLELTRRGRAAAPPEIGYAIDRMGSAAERMTTLVEDLLLLARLDAGRPLRREEVDLTALAVEATSDAHVAGPQHRWMLDLPPEVVSVPGDPDRLHQVLANLLTNARVHTPAGTTVTTSLTVEGAQAVLRVTDDGPGIPPPLLAKVFERFARGDSSRSRTAGSSGLGLAIVSSVVAAHRGTVDVESVPGCTRFTVRLPCGFTDDA